MKKNKDQSKTRNFVAKHAMQKSGAGRHVDKKGQKAPRVRQKREWKKDVQHSLKEQRIVKNYSLTDAQKEVLTRTINAANPKVAGAEIAGKPKHVTARDMLAKYGLIDWDKDTGALEVTEKGIETMQNENLVDETGELTDEGKKYAYDADEQQPPTAKDSTDVGASPMEQPTEQPMESIFMQIAETLTSKEREEAIDAAKGRKD